MKVKLIRRVIDKLKEAKASISKNKGSVIAKKVKNMHKGMAYNMTKAISKFKKKGMLKNLEMFENNAKLEIESMGYLNFQISKISNPNLNNHHDDHIRNGDVNNPGNLDGDEGFNNIKLKIIIPDEVKNLRAKKIKELKQNFKVNFYY